MKVFCNSNLWPFTVTWQTLGYMSVVLNWCWGCFCFFTVTLQQQAFDLSDTESDSWSESKFTALLFFHPVKNPVAFFKSGSLKTKYLDRNTEVINVKSGEGQGIEGTSLIHFLPFFSICTSALVTVMQMGWKQFLLYWTHGQQAPWT